MKFSFSTSAALLTLASVSAVRAHAEHAAHHNHARAVQHNRRQGVAEAAAAATTVASGVSASIPAVPVSATGAPVVTPTPVVLTTTSAATGTGLRPLSEISSGMATQSGLPLTATYTAGQAAKISGAPPLPSPFVIDAAAWPKQDVIPPTDTPQVQKWMKELDGWTIPNLDPTVEGDCAKSPDALKNAEARGWWTCGGWTRPTDITVCPNKMDWGVSFDDGPSPYTQKLLNYLTEKKLLATFFVVGSRCLSNAPVLLEEYMSGHEISVHTWSHHPLTAMTNAQIVAELGWTREIIKKITGVTPTTMRAPFGDMDDRVRAISLAMGLQPIQWTRGASGTFDTNDWRVAAGQVTSTQQMQIFAGILTNASALNTGFIVLEHDLYEQAVELAIGYTLDTALKHNPPFSLKPIGTCQGWPANNLYLETTSNATFPFHNSTAGANKGQASGNSTTAGSGAVVGVAASGALAGFVGITMAVVAALF